MSCQLLFGLNKRNRSRKDMISTSRHESSETQRLVRWPVLAPSHCTWKVPWFEMVWDLRHRYWETKNDRDLTNIATSHCLRPRYHSNGLPQQPLEASPEVHKGPKKSYFILACKLKKRVATLGIFLSIPCSYIVRKNTCPCFFKVFPLSYHVDSSFALSFTNSFTAEQNSNTKL